MKSKHLLLLLLLAIGLPWAANAQNQLNEGFESATFPPEDWTAIHVSGSNSWARNTAYNHTTSGAASAYMAYAYSGHENYLVTPKLMPNSGEALSFYATSQSYSGTTLTIEVSTTTPTAAAFTTTLATYTTGSSSSNYIGTNSLGTWVELTIPATALTAYVGQPIYIAFHVVDNNGSHLYLDDITGVTKYVSSTPEPKNLTPSNITHEGATLSWQAPSNATPSSYLYNYKKSADANWGPEGMVNNGTSVDITGLNALTEYQFRVKADYGTTGQSDYIETSFTTTNVATAVGDAWSDDFEGDACEWELVNGTLTNAWAWGTATNNGGTHAIYVSNDGGTTNAYTNGSAAMVYATKLLNFADGKYEFSFDWNGNGESNYDYLRVALVPASVTLTAGTSTPSYFSYSTLPSGWIALDGGSKLNLATAWQSKSVAINVTAGNYYLVMAWRNDGGGGTNPPAAVDNVSITRVACAYEVEGLAVDNVTTNSATLTWTAGEATQWQVTFADNGNFDNATEAIVSAATYNMTGLQPSTKYYAKVRAYCGGEDFGSWSNVIEVLTDCAIIPAVGYTENFDSYTAAAGVLPICWNKINTTTYSSYQGYPRIYNYSSQSSPNCLYFYSYYSSYYDYYDPQDQYAILPEMENLAGKLITLSAKANSNTVTFKIGLMTDPADATTFTEMATQALTSSYQEFEYVVPADATAHYIAIMMEAASSSSATRYVYIDDITIAEPPACPKPTDLTVVANSVTPHSVQLSWVSDATAWIVAYKTADDEDFTEVNATENPFTLTGLTDGMTYTAKVCAVCDGTPGEWTSTTVSFTTPIACPAPTNLAYSGITGSQTTLNWTGTSDSYDVLYRTAAYSEGIYENFGTSIPSGWEMYTGLLTNGTATMTSATYGWDFGTNNGVFDDHARVNIYGNNQKWLVTKAFTILQDASTLSFDIALTAYTGDEVPAPATTGTDDKFIVLISTDNMSSWITLREWNNSGSEYVYNNIANTAIGENVVIDLSAYVGQNVRIAFYGESTESNADNNLHIDNVHCGIPHEAGEWQTAAEGVTGTTYTLTGLNSETDYEAKVLSNCEGETGHETIISFTTEAACMVPTELTVVSVTTTTAVLTWTSSSTAWQIQVDEEEPIEVTSIPYTLEGLTPATTYTFKVRANCDGSYTEWSNAASFTTECEVIAAEGYSENFDSYEVASNYTAPSTRVLPNCWSAINTTTYSSYMQLPSIYYYSSTNYANTTPNCLKFYSYYYYDYYYGTDYDPQPQYAILPEMTGLAGMQVTLQARGYNTSSTFKIGTMTDPADASTFVAITEQALTTSYQQFEYLIPTDAQGHYLAIMIDAANEDRTSNGVYIDDIVISTPPTCLKPTDLEVTATTTTTATFSWTNGAADQTAWQICLNGDETNLIMAGSNPFTVEDLTASTNYTAKVRAYCSEEDQSDWSNEVSFATECEPYTITAEAPYTQNFESPVVTTTYNQVGEMPVCWDNYPSTNASAKILAAGATYNYAASGQVLYFYGSGNNYAALPEFTNALNTLQISFKYATESNSNGTLTLGYITDEDVNYNSFTAIEGGTFAASSASDDTFVDVEPIALSALPANATRLVFRWYYSGQWGANVDNVEVSLLPTFTKHIIGYASDEEGSNGNNYYLIASPLAAEVAPTTVGGMITDEYGTDVTPATSTYDLYSFDEAEDLEWQNYRAASNFNLVNGQGYLYASKEGTTLTFTGAPYSGDTKEVTLSMTDNENADFQGWNLVGNPFTDLAYIDRPFYRMDATGTRVLAEEQTGAIQVMEGVFVIATEDEEHMAFSTVAPNNNGKGLVLNLSQGRGNTIDRAIVGIGQGHTLPKFMFNPNDTKLYIPQNGKDYAVVRSRVSDEIPVNFLPTEDGYYKISVDVRNMNLRSLVLKDKVRNVSIDLLRTPNYMFKASAYDRADRFVLSFKNGNGIYKEKIVKGANPEDFSFYSNGVFVIDNEGEANLQVIDMNGRVLSSENIYGSTSIQVDAAPGIYLLRLTNGDNVKVQKVVVE